LTTNGQSVKVALFSLKSVLLFHPGQPDFYLTVAPLGGCHLKTIFQAAHRVCRVLDVSFRLVVVIMIRIAVTGGIACGKSLAAAFMQKAGVAVCEADVVAHALMAPGTEVFRRILDRFGTQILSADGAIDRRILGELVFNDGEQRERLNAAVHPAVRSAMAQWLAREETSGTRMAAAVIPLLFEADMASGWEAVVCIACSLPVQMERLRSRGLEDAACRARLSVQMPLEEKCRRSDFAIMNDGSPEELSASVMRTLKVIEEKYA